MRTPIAGLVTSLLTVACTSNVPEATGLAPQAEDIAAQPDDNRHVVANISYPDVATNLIVNGDFEDYPDANVPDRWTVDEIYGYRGMFTPVEGWLGRGVQFLRNAQGQHLLSQTVQVEPQHRYTAQLVYRVDGTDASRGGLYVIDPADGRAIAQDEINRPTNGWQIATASFDSGDRTQLTISIGYPAGMNGTVVYDGVRLFEDAGGGAYQLQMRYRDAIGIPEMHVNELVPELADYVTLLLAAPRVVRMAHRDAYAVALPYYLYQYLGAGDGSAGRSAWCQRTSLALAELLALYGVPTRQVHATSLQHQFLEYLDGERWVAFDPYYGIRYVLDGVRLGVEETVRAGMDNVSIEVPTQKHVFFLELGYLKPMWANGGFVHGLAM